MSITRSLTSEQVDDAVRALRSGTCPACGVEKHPNLESFCDGCLRRLPSRLQEEISEGSRYLELFQPALAYVQREMMRQSPEGPMAQADGSGPEETEI